jgi:hypothetical protein
VLTGAQASSDEMKFKGSDDWLTLIAVADTREKLDKILKETHVPPSNPDTSMSSRRATIELHVGEVRQSFKDRLTIASGPIVKITPPHPVIDVVHVKVLPSGTNIGDLKPNNPLVAEFNGSSIAILDE